MQYHICYDSVSIAYIVVHCKRPVHKWSGTSRVMLILIASQGHDYIGALITPNCDRIKIIRIQCIPEMWTQRDGLLRKPAEVDYCPGLEWDLAVLAALEPLRMFPHSAAFT